ncbi:MAG: site-specific integrase [Gracilibacteraceae bacterium]|jgi:integrase|nr:site-specific integrase [Gracilibacteraceae bacterium]
MATNKKASKLPTGVTAVNNRPGLYRLSIQVNNKRFTEYHRPDEHLTQRQLQSVLQKKIDAFRVRAERGSLRGQVTDKSTLDECAAWYFDTAKLENRESTIIKDKYNYERYIAPHLGSVKVKSITPPMVSQLLADLLDHGGGTKVIYSAKPEFIKLMYEKKPSRQAGGFNLVARELNIGVDNTFVRVRRGDNCEKEIAEKVAEYFGVPLAAAFDKKSDEKPLSAGMVRSITYTLSAILTALVRSDVIPRNPVMNATKPRVGEAERGAYLTPEQLPIFQSGLDGLAYDGVRVGLTLCLHLGLRSGESRALRWQDIDFLNNIVNIDHNAVHTNRGLAIGEPKTKRSIRKLPLSPYLRGVLLEHRKAQVIYSRSLGSQWQDNNLICPNTTGGIMENSRYHIAVKSIVKAYPELPADLHPHSLRHTFVTLLIADGLDVVTVASLAGDTVDIIAKTYAHALKGREAAAMDRIGDVFAKIAPPRRLTLIVSRN